ncbi:putative transposase protein, partial [Haloplasma contractile SSD-17B]
MFGEIWVREFVIWGGDTLKFNRKIEIIFNPKTTLILDSQSQICNSLYNELLETINQEYKNNPKDATLLKGRNLRDLIPVLKQSKPYLKTVYSSPLKNVAFRLLDAFNQFFNGERGYPKFRAQKRKWFSLFYDEPYKGYKLKDRQLLLSLGKSNKQIRVTGLLKEKLHLKETDLVKTFRLCKQHGKFYGIFCIERVT